MRSLGIKMRSLIEGKRGVSGAVYAVLIVAVLFGALLYSGVINLQVTPEVEEAISPKVPEAGPYAGPLSVYETCYDGFDIATTYTHGTNYNCYWLFNRGAGWIQVGSGDTTVEITRNDNGYLYALVSIPSGQNYYVDYAQILAKNSRVQSIIYEDVTNDGINDFVFKIYVGDIPIPEASNPQFTFFPYLRAYQAPSLNSPSDQTGIGTAQSDIFIEWYLSFSNTKKSFQLVKVELTFNTTDISKLTLDYVNIPGLGTVDGSQFAYNKLSSSTEYTYTIGSDLSNGLWINYGTNQLNKFPFDTKLITNFSSGDQIGVTLTLYGLTPTGKLTTITDTVGLAES